jgi:hypothetical protein
MNDVLTGHILATCSRRFKDWSGARAILTRVHGETPDAVLMHGDCEDGDRQIAGIWRGDARSDWWLSEPAVGRVADGLPKRLVAPHLHALGNAVVHQVGLVAGRRVMAMAGAVAA